MTIEPERHPASGFREEYEKRLAIWHRIVREPLFHFLKHDRAGRTILSLFANGQISMGKCAEAIVEKFCLGIDPDLPEWKGYSDVGTNEKKGA